MQPGWRFPALFLATMLAAHAASADPVPAKAQAPLVLRILAYDHNLAHRVDGKKVTIAVVYKAGNSDSDEASGELANTIAQIGKTTTLSNNAISVLRLAYSDKTFDADIQRAHASAVYVAPALGNDLGNITATTQSRKLLSFTGNQDYVAAGVSVGFASDSDHTMILINLPASRNEGADLDVALLRVAKIIKK
jgi:hypothetical protein